MVMKDDKIIKLIIEIPAHIKEELDKLPDGCRYTDGWNIATAIMNGIPYEDRLQGEWIQVQDNVDHYKCSICGDHDFYENWIPNYCPNCGAKMVRGDKEDNE